MASVGFQYEPESLDVNKVCFEKEPDISKTSEKSRKSKSVTEWSSCGKIGVHTIVEFLSCGKIEALRYFQLLDMRDDGRNVVIERIITTIQQLCLI